MSDSARAAAAVAGAIALSLVASACASTGATPKPFPMAGVPSTRGASPTGTDAAAPPPVTTPPIETSPGSPESVSLVVRTALQLRGIPYRNGGADPQGFDCSGFTQYVFAVAGAALPREVREQFRIGTPVQPGTQRPGDLMFFSTTAPGASHVGIAIGGDGFVHAPSSRGAVRVEQMSVPYWSNRLVGIRRVGAN